MKFILPFYSKISYCITFLSILILQAPLTQLHAEEDYIDSEPKVYSGIIVLKDRTRIESDFIKVEKEIVVFQNESRLAHDTIDIDKLHFIRADCGNYAVEGALVTGTLFGLLALRYSDRVVVSEILNVTGVGLGVGLIVGLLTNRTETIMIKSRYQISLFGRGNYANITSLFPKGNLMSLEIKL